MGRGACGFGYIHVKVRDNEQAKLTLGR